MLLYRRIKRGLAPWSRLKRDRRGAAALEFAIVAPVFLAITFCIMEMGVDYTVNAALDGAIDKAIYALKSGIAQLNVTNVNDFKTNYVCPQIPAYMDCTNVGVTVRNVSVLFDSSWNLTNSPSITTAAAIFPGAIATPGVNGVYCPGSGYDYVGIILTYPMPLIATIWSSASTGTFNGQPVRVFNSQAIFVNLPVFSAANPAGC